LIAIIHLINLNLLNIFYSQNKVKNQFYKLIFFIIFLKNKLYTGI
jgi:hypothetical protein